MAFCPFYNLECPEDFSCAIWTKFGCCVHDKPGICSAQYTSGGKTVDVHILQVTRTGFPPPRAQHEVVFAYDSDGVLGIDEDLSKFVIYRVHYPNSRG